MRIKRCLMVVGSQWLVPSESVIARLGICIRLDVWAFFLSSMSMFYLLSLACDGVSALISSELVEKAQ